MRAVSTIAAFGLAATLFAPALSSAAAGDIGQREYTENCAVCHGTEGRGDGPMAGIINQEVPDLTVLAAQNDGIFPFAAMYEVIDGTREARAHGTRDMPVWGSVYNAEAPQWLGYDYAGQDADSFVRGRILSLIGYIQTLQAK